MTNPLNYVKKGWRILTRRLRDQGLKTTLIWVFGRGIPKLTGVPMLRYSEITPEIYVGPQYNQRGKTALERAGIQNGVNMRIEYDDAEHGVALLNYCHLPTVDDAAPSIEHLNKGVAFIREAVARGEKVYIHCAGGIGRAPTMAAAYFISTGMSLDEAVALMKSRRPFIRIMPPQWEVLRRYETAQQEDQ